MEGKPVKLNVGGKRFLTTRDTSKKGENFLTRLVDNYTSGTMTSTVDEDGYLFIDRSGSKFEVVLEYLRSGVLETGPFNRSQILRELDFFGIATPPVPGVLLPVISATKDRMLLQIDPIIEENLSMWTKLLAEQISETRPQLRLYFSLTSHSNYGPFTSGQLESGLFRSLLASRLTTALGLEVQIRVRDPSTVVLTCNVAKTMMQDDRPADAISDLIDYFTQFEGENKLGNPVLNVMQKE